MQDINKAHKKSKKWLENWDMQLTGRFEIHSTALKLALTSIQSGVGNVPNSRHPPKRQRKTNNKTLF